MKYTTRQTNLIAVIIACWCCGARDGAAADAGRLFPADLPEAQWVDFQASGFAKDVTGIIYRGDPYPISGVPLGGIGCGCIDLDPAGTFGYSSIFNHLTPRGGPLNMPFLGMSFGEQTWVLTTGRTKQYDGCVGYIHPPVPLGPDMVLDKVKMVEALDYWGHHPIVDMEYQTDAPVSVALRAWSVFIPGDARISNTPGAVFEVRLRNLSQLRQQGTVAFSFPGFDSHKTARDRKGNVWEGPPNPPRRNLPERKIVRKPLTGDPTGAWVADENWNMSYVLGVLDRTDARLGAALGIDGNKWNKIRHELPETTPDDGGTSLAIDLNLNAGEQQVIRFVLTWHAPYWQGDGMPETGGNTYTHMYASHYPDAPAAATFLAKNHESLLGRILSWQKELYDTTEIPGWLADSLINNLNTIVKTGIWAQAKPPIGEWCRPEDGLFALNESPRGCSQLDTSPNSAVGNLPLVYFFPECERSTLRALKAYQYEDGRPPWALGGCLCRFVDGVARGIGYYEMVKPSHGWQTVMNGSNYMVRLDRYYRVTKDKSFLQEFYESAKLATKFAFNQRPNYRLSQIVAMPTYGTDAGKGPIATEWLEDRPYRGYVSHAGGYRMAHARIMRRWAQEMGDTKQADLMDAYLEAGAKALEEHLWTGTYYRCFHEPETDTRSDRIFTVQLDGQYFARAHGVSGVFPAQRVNTTLETIREKCFSVGRLGIPPNFVNPDGSAALDIGGYGPYRYFTFTTYMLAMNYMYAGEMETGIELLHRCLELFSCLGAYTWDGRTGANAETGWGDGTDYYMNMALWGVPAAIVGEDISGPCQPGGLVNRMIRAGAE